MKTLLLTIIACLMFANPAFAGNKRQGAKRASTQCSAKYGVCADALPQYSPYGDARQQWVVFAFGQSARLATDYTTSGIAYTIKLLKDLPEGTSIKEGCEVTLRATPGNSMQPPVEFKHFIKVKHELFYAGDISYYEAPMENIIGTPFYGVHYNYYASVKVIAFHYCK